MRGRRELSEAATAIHITQAVAVRRGLPLPVIDPVDDRLMAEHITEACVIIALIEHCAS